MMAATGEKEPVSPRFKQLVLELLSKSKIFFSCLSNSYFGLRMTAEALSLMIQEGMNICIGKKR